MSYKSSFESQHLQLIVLLLYQVLVWILCIEVVSAIARLQNRYIYYISTWQRLEIIFDYLANFNIILFHLSFSQSSLGSDIQSRWFGY